MSEAIGHEAVLQRISPDSLGHAVLFSGPGQVGKTTIARSLAFKILSADKWPGGLDADPDFWVEDSDAERIGIDRVREDSKDENKSLKEFFSLRPYAGEHRVAIIARAERLTEEAANAVLKLIEEPAAGSHIIICAQSVQSLPETIVSRCQHFVFSPVEDGAISRWLVDVQGIDGKAVQTAVALAGGRPGYALKLASDSELLSEVNSYLQSFVELGGLGTQRLLERAGELAPQGNAAGREQAILQVSIWASFVRDVIRRQADPAAEVSWKSFSEEIALWAAAIPMSKSTQILDKLVESIDALANYANPRLCLEALLLQIFIRTPAPPAVSVAVAK